MTDVSVPPPPLLATAPPPVPAAAEWQRLPDAAAQLAMAGGLLRGLVFGIALALVLALPLRDVRGQLPPVAWVALLALVVFLACAFGTWIGYRRWKYSAWKLDATGLQVRRGRWWQREVLVPRSRVQHLDIERGPIERNFGLATLVVHTAGSRVHALRQPGFADADAIALRDALVPDSARHDDVL